MILFALIFHKLGHYIYSWISKKKPKDIRTGFTWNLYLFEMSGVIMNFALSFLIILVITITSKEEYLRNENAKFGIICSGTAKSIGFEDGDKIISVNNKSIEIFNDIVKSIISQTGNVEVIVQRNGAKQTIIISENDKLKLIQNNYGHFIPKMHPDSTDDFSKNYLKFDERRKGLKEALSTYWSTIKIPLKLVLPEKSQFKNLGGFTVVGSIHNSPTGYFYLIAFSCILVGLINLLPIPGLDLGNVIIAIIENKLKRKFNPRLLRNIRIACSSLIIITYLIIIFLK